MKRFLNKYIFIKHKFSLFFYLKKRKKRKQHNLINESKNSLNKIKKKLYTNFVIKSPIYLFI